MNIEFVLWWLLAGIIADLILILFVTASFRGRMKEFYDRYDRSPPPFFDDYLEAATEAPWWGHAIAILLPPSIILHPAMSG